MNNLTFLASYHLVHNDELNRYDVYIDEKQLREQAIKAKTSKNLQSRDGALVVKVIKP